MESAVETAESSPIVTEREKPIRSAVETVERPSSTISEGKEPTPSAVEDQDVTVVSERKKTTPSAVETADNDVTIISESKKPTPSTVETADDDVTIISESKKPTTAQLAVETVENASIISESSSHEGHRLWIGNIDPKITEYHLVKLLEKFGKVKQFDFLFHKSGPLEGQPRGYCFVNFHTKEEAERAIHCLNGKLALSKKLVVRWAHAQVKRFEGFRGDKNGPASLEPSCSAELDLPTNLSTSAKIRAIEAKLQMMEENPDEEYQGPSAYMYNKPPEKKRQQPYSRPFRKFRR
ncbi:putative RNA-binding protein 18 isoform X1 [Oncorhynchus kisutch]|uniref:Probable RNA-binding protein 18 n=1 Tax=Oncorhynchus kisutch TaxID=8019 RepID=A0A8C7IPL1_ONCKI|nr:probable RNA-binding protein 18 isoform X1 [Oncorhynchus kisutch]XP_020313357.1 probable RNA-binding protein 18 isoform X1 [Oncorhynchus kisutch]XP_031658774.1 probable RNA-binding protein 18 isoform X1 [Oncorhynchus kisutch]XP_046225497.1 probable RNA-binding protein 18 isoform X1 [Oncorhynchus gorbuscha]XP_046225498.1 probable RNA-binding protein 18 isoform X1 [Oncorhynchus gorbuscha]